MTELKAEWIARPGGDVYAIKIDGHVAFLISMADHQRYPGLIKHILHGIKLWAEKRDAPKDGGKL